jgi:hypothetical protein
VFDWDRLGDDYMGECEIDLDKCLKNPGKWMIDSDFQLTDPKKEAPKANPVKGYIYLQIKFVEENIEDLSGPLEFRADLMKVSPGAKSAEKKVLSKEEKKKVEIKGRLFLNIINGRNLKKGDSSNSDSFCICKISNKSQGKTEKITNLNPTWNFKTSFPVTITEGAPIPTVDFEVFDWDYLKNDLLGTCSVSLENLMKPTNKNKWFINSSVQLIDPDTKKVGTAGSIYIQCKYMQKADGTEATAEEGGECPIKQEEMKVEGVEFSEKNYKGTLTFHVVCGRNLRIADSSSSDPLCQILFRGTKYKTDKIKSTLDPDWKKMINIPIDIKSVVNFAFFFSELTFLRVKFQKQRRLCSTGID